MQLMGFSAYTIKVILKVNENYFSGCLHAFFKGTHNWL